MATRVFSRYTSLFSTRQFICRSFTFYSSTYATVYSLSLSHLSFLRRFRPLAAVSAVYGSPAIANGFRAFSTRLTQSSLSDSSPNWSNRPPKETILLDGCDFEHWLVVMDKPDESWTRDGIIKWYIQTLAKIIGSEEEARMKIYSVSTKHYFAFGALVSEELSNKLKDLENVRWVLPDSYLDVKNKDYGGEPFINGEAVPYDPKYHEEWVRNNQKAMERNRRNDRPRNSDRSRNFERRRNNMQNPGPAPSYNQNVPNRGSPSYQNMPSQVPPTYNQGPPMQNQGPPMQNQGPPPAPGNMGAPNMDGSSQYNRMPPSGGPPNAGWGTGQNNNYGGMQQQQHQNRPMPGAGQYQGYPSNNMAGPAGVNQYQQRDLPGGDMPPPSPPSHR